MTLAELDRRCAGATRVLLDSSTLIAYHSPPEPAYPLATHLFARIANPDDPLLGYCSLISASELGPRVEIRIPITGSSTVAALAFNQGTPTIWDSYFDARPLMVRPIRSGKDRADFMHDFLTSYPGLTLLPVDLMAAMQAATLLSATNIRLPDALIVATGLLAGCEVIISNDERWQRQFSPLYPQFRWLYLNDYLPV